MTSTTNNDKTISNLQFIELIVRFQFLMENCEETSEKQIFKTNFSYIFESQINSCNESWLGIIYTYRSKRSMKSCVLSGYVRQMRLTKIIDHLVSSKIIRFKLNVDVLVNAKIFNLEYSYVHYYWVSPNFSDDELIIIN